MKESELWHKKILENKDYFKNKLGQSRLRHSSLNFRELERSHTVKNYESKCLRNSKQVLCWFACFTVSSNTLSLESFKCLLLCTFSHPSMIWEIYVIPMYFIKKKLSVNLLFPYMYLFHILSVLFALSLVFFFHFCLLLFYTAIISYVVFKTKAYYYSTQWYPIVYLFFLLNFYMSLKLLEPVSTDL